MKEMKISTFQKSNVTKFMVSEKEVQDLVRSKNRSGIIQMSKTKNIIPRILQKLRNLLTGCTIMDFQPAATELVQLVRPSWVVPQIALVLKIFAWDLCDAVKGFALSLFQNSRGSNVMETG